MKKVRLTSNFLFALIIVTVGFSAAQAQATRTWVSGVGDDVNPCSRTAPCKTWAGAISKTAAGGEIDALDPGGFGTVTITKSITLDGMNVGSIISSGVNGIIVNDVSSTALVIIRNMSINGAGVTQGVNGVRILAAQSVSVEHSNIYNFTTGTGRGISDERTVANGTLYVTDTIIQNCTTGIAATPTSGNSGVRGVIDHVRTINNTQFGVSSTAQARIAVSNSVASGNGTAGYDVEGGAFVTLDSNSATTNTTGLAVTVGSMAVITNSSFIGNATGISNGGSVRTFGNNKIDSNATNISGNLLTGPGGSGPSQQ